MTSTSPDPYRIAVVLPYAVSIRDFVGSGLLSELALDPTLALTIYTLNPDLPELAAAREAGIELKPLVPYADSRQEAVLKALYLYLFSDKFVYVGQNLQGRPLRKALATVLVLLRKTLGVRRFLRLYEKLMLRLFRGRGLPHQIAGEPNLLIGTRSLLNSIDYGIVAEARLRNIPILTLAGSWDNFTTKGFFPFKAERIVVWNAKMKRELEEIFGVAGPHVEIAGYPRKTALELLSRGIDAAAYLASLGHGEYRRFVLYSASYSELTMCPGDEYPLEYQVIAQVAARLEEKLPSDMCIILRMHPFSEPEGTEIFKSLRRSFTFIPGRRDKYVERVMTTDDEAALARQIALSECVVSLASTITIDALSLDRPVINTCFDPRPDVSYRYSNRRIFAFNHFRDIARLVSLPLAQTPEETVDYVLSAIEGRLEHVVDHTAFRKWYVPEISDEYKRTVAKIVRETVHRSHGSSEHAATSEQR
jgi:hypothetical protein